MPAPRPPNPPGSLPAKSPDPPSDSPAFGSLRFPELLPAGS